MSLMEKGYLTMVLFLFVSFMVLTGTLAFLDAKEGRIRKHRARRDASAAKKQDGVEHRVAMRH